MYLKNRMSAISILFGCRALTLVQWQLNITKLEFEKSMLKQKL